MRALFSQVVKIFMKKAQESVHGVSLNTISKHQYVSIQNLIGMRDSVIGQKMSKMDRKSQNSSRSLKQIDCCMVGVDH